jgi:hypothetical protein
MLVQRSKYKQLGCIILKNSSGLHVFLDFLSGLEEFVKE